MFYLDKDEVEFEVALQLVALQLVAVVETASSLIASSLIASEDLPESSCHRDRRTSRMS